MTSPQDPYFKLWDEVPDPEKKEERSSESDPTIPDGEHNCRIEAFGAFESKTNDIWLKFTLSVLGGSWNGRTLVRMVAPFGRRQDDLEYRAKQARWAKEDLLLVLGEVPNIWEVVNPETRQAEAGVASQIVGAMVKAQKTTKMKNGDEWINVYLNDLLSPAPLSQQAEEAASPPPPPPPTDGNPAALPRGEFGMKDPEDEIPY